MTKACIWLVVAALSLTPVPARAALFWGDLPGEGGFALIDPAGEGRRLHWYSWGAPGQIADLARMNLDLLNRLALALTANEKARRRFRTAMMIRVSRIETTVEMILGAQIAEAHKCVESEAMEKHAKGAEERISQVSENLGLAIQVALGDN